MTFEEAKKLIEELDSGLISCNMDYEGGFSDAKYRVLEILDEIDTEPVGNLDKLTLTELAKKLRKIFGFKYLTASRSGVELFIVMYRTKPEFNTIWKGWDMGNPVAPCPIAASEDLRCDLDLSEYKDENGEIDYSKCIVEVE